jgi:hypothetical protein
MLSFSGVPGCGGLLTEASGQFSSPSHPETYQHNLDCEWVIRVPGYYNKIRLSFVSFDLEAHDEGHSEPVEDYWQGLEGPEGDYWEHEGGYSGLGCRQGLIINQICKCSYKPFFLCQLRLPRDPRGQRSRLLPERTVLRQQPPCRVHLRQKHPVRQVQVGLLGRTQGVQDQLRNG